jgi:hypothetical protein
MLAHSFHSLKSHNTQGKTVLSVKCFSLFKISLAAISYKYIYSTYLQKHVQNLIQNGCYNFQSKTETETAQQFFIKFSSIRFNQNCFTHSQFVSYIYTDIATLGGTPYRYTNSPHNTNTD